MDLRALNDNEVEAYHRDGYLVVESLYDSDEITRWKQDVEVALGDERIPESGVRIWMCDAMPATLLSRMTAPGIVTKLRQLIGDHVEFLSAKAVLKDRRITFASPWHLDWYYWYGAPKISIWIALDDARPENGCLRMIPGSHLVDFENRYDEREDSFNNHIDDAQLAGMSDRTLSVQRGDVVFFSDRTAHSSHLNTSGKDRFSFISTYRDASVVDDSKVWNTALVVSGQSTNVPQARRAKCRP